MKAAIVHKHGDPTTAEVISVVEDLPIPQPKQGEILLKVHAAAINPVDWKMIENRILGFKGGPIGADVSGIVEAIGPDTVTDLVVGEEVYGDAIATKGAFGEYAIVQAIVLAKKPSKITMVEAAALPLAGLTALQGLTTQGQLTEGQKVLVIGGSGGVGSLAVQMAKKLGASEVVATGSEVKLIKDLGADLVVNYKEENLIDALKGKDFDLVFDTIGGYEHWELGQASLKPTGTFITIAGDGGSNIVTLLGSILWRTLYYKLFGGQRYSFFLTDTTSPAVEKDMKTLTELVEGGTVKPVLAETQYELTTDGIHELIKASKSHRAKGKLVLKVA